jgi:hypothetical protein
MLPRMSLSSLMKHQMFLILIFQSDYNISDFIQPDGNSYIIIQPDDNVYDIV